MEKELIQSSIFDPIINYISHFGENRYIEFTLPKTLVIDSKEVLKYFEADVSQVFQQNEAPKITGTLKDNGLFLYLKKQKELNPFTIYFEGEIDFSYTSKDDDKIYYVEAERASL